MLGNITRNIIRAASFIIKLLYLIVRLIFRGFKTLFKKTEEKFSGRNLKIRYKLIILFLIVILPSVIFTFISFGLVKNTISTQIDAYQKSIVKSSVKVVQHYILNCQKPLLNLAEDRNFRGAVSRSDRRELNRILQRIFKKYKTFSFVGIVGKKGNSLYMKAVYPPAGYGNISEDDKIYDYLGLNFKTPKFRTSPVFIFNGSREVIIVFPLKGALLVGGINVRNLSQLLGKTKPMPESEFIVLDKNGNLMVGKSIDKDYNPPQQAGVRKVETKKSVIYYEPIEIINGWVGLETPDIAIYRNLTYLIRLLIVFIVFSVAVALLLAIYFSKKVTGPVENLNMGARILGAGNLAYRIELKTGDEIQELADEFNLMAEKLKESYDSLGDKIRIATRDLQDAYSQIEDKNQQLKKADKLKSEFLASMSHELRTPINAIIGFSSLMEEGTYGKLTQRQEETLDKIIRNTNNLLNLINDILDLSKIEAGRMSLHTEKIKVNNLLKELSEELRPLAEAKGLDFKLDTGKDINCKNDYTRLKQIVTNLVSNAIKFTKEGEVIIKSEILKEGFLITVNDTGIGIKKEQLKNIFDEFVQADGSVTREFGGTGLGLSISKKLIDMMGGKIEIESKWEQGSSFKVFLPYETD